MIHDYEQELTTAGGQLFDAADTASEYGTKPFDMKAAGIDPAVGEKLQLAFRLVDADSDVGTSLQFDVVESTTGAAGGTEVVVGTKTVAVAGLTTAAGNFYIGIDQGQISKRYLALKVTTAGSAATAGKISAWLVKGSDAIPKNAGITV